MCACVEFDLFIIILIFPLKLVRRHEHSDGESFSYFIYLRETSLFLSRKGDIPPSVLGGNPGSLQKASRKKMKLYLIVVLSLISVIAFACSIIFLYILRRKVAKSQGNCFA